MIISLQFFGGNGQSLTSGLGVNPGNPIPLLDDDADWALSHLLRGKESIVYQAPVEDVSLNNIKTVQPALRRDSLEYALSGGEADRYPVIVSTQQGNVVLDGNHRVVAALVEGKTSIRAHHIKASDLSLSAEKLEELYRRKD